MTVMRMPAIGLTATALAIGATLVGCGSDKSTPASSTLSSSSSPASSASPSATPSPGQTDYSSWLIQPSACLPCESR